MSVRYPCGPNAPAGRRAERASAPARHSSPLPASLACHARPFVGVFQKSIYKRTRQLLAINAHRMAPRTTRWLQERQGDAPTKGLAWCGRGGPDHLPGAPHQHARAGTCSAAQRVFRGPPTGPNPLSSSADWPCAMGVPIPFSM
jgi:hypothetical protein